MAVQGAVANDPLKFRWLGVAGLELTAGEQILVIDPFFTRPAMWRLAGSRVRPDRDLTLHHVPRCHQILVTHAHWDHLMDVPDLAMHTGAAVWGSANACRLAAVAGVPHSQLHPIVPGDTLCLGRFEVEVLPARHGRTPLDRWISAPLAPDLRPPLRLLDYRMDDCFSFLIRASCTCLLDGDQATAADLLFTVPLLRPGRFDPPLPAGRPRVVVPIHWDDSFRPLSRGIRPSLEPPRWAWPPLRRFDLAGFRRQIEEMAPGTRVLIPRAFHPYSVADLLST